MRGVVDSEDISLNISREMLQHDPKLQKIKSGLTKRVLGELKKKAEADAEGYAAFWENFGPVLKEGIYEDQANRDAILTLARFRTSAGDTPASLDDYVGRMKEGQDAIFYIAAENPTAALASPQLEGFKAKNVEVLLLTDPVDEFWVDALGTYKDKPFKSATRAGAALDAIATKDGDGKKEDEKKDDHGDMNKGIAAAAAPSTPDAHNREDGDTRTKVDLLALVAFVVRRPCDLRYASGFQSPAI